MINIKQNKHQNIHSSSIYKACLKLSENNKIFHDNTIYLNLQNIRRFGKELVLQQIKKVFPKHHIYVYTKETPNLEVKEIMKAYALSGSLLSPIIECEIHGESVSALLDTGAHISLIDANFADKMKLPIISGEEKSIIGITGNTMPVKGIIKTEVNCQGEKLSLELCVVENCDMDTPILLGMDSLVTGKFFIDFRDLSVRINNKLIKMDHTICDIYKESRNKKLWITNKVKLLPGKVTPIKIKAKPSDKVFSINYLNPLLEQLKLTSLQYQCHAVASTMDGCFVIELNNNAKKPVYLKPGTYIGNITLLEPSKSTNHINIINILKSKCTEQEISQREDIIWNKVKERIKNTDNLSSFEAIIRRNAAAFAKDDMDLGCVKDFEHHIDLLDKTPVACRPYRTPHSKEDEIQKHIDRLLELGVISPSHSAYAAPCLLVGKKDGSTRLVIDFRKLNKLITPISYPLPHLETAIQSLGNNKVFSTLDLLAGYHQVPLRKEDRHITAFTTGRGLYQFNRTPFGMVTSGAAMQQIIERVLAGLNNRICLVYVDDIIIFGKNEEEHDNNLNEVLTRLAHHGYKISIRKCTFKSSEVECLGHVVSEYGVKPNPHKTETLKKWKKPQNAKQTRSFLGLCGYYRRFIQHFATKAAPLTKLTKKNKPFKWTEAAENAFHILINELTNTPLLVFPNYDHPFIVTVDASQEAMGAILSQNIEGIERPIAYYSRKFNEAESKYCTWEREGLAIKDALRKWRYFLLGNKVVVRSDNQPVIAMFRDKETKGRIARYLPIIMEYDITFEYIIGKNNVVADCLSRPFNSGTNNRNIKQDLNEQQQEENNLIQINKVGKINVIPNEKDFIEAQMEDPILRDLTNCKKKNFKYYKKDSIWFSRNLLSLNDQLLIPQKYRESFFKYFHCRLGNHQGMSKTYYRMAESIYWPGMKEEVKKYISQCDICLRAKPDHRPSHELGQFPIPKGPFEIVHIDLIGPLPRGKNKKKYICTIVDRFTRYTIAKPIVNKCPEKVLQVIKEEILNSQYCPQLIICDEGTEFTSHCFMDFCHNKNIKIHYISPYHHSSNGMVERANYTIENMLRCSLLEFGKNWTDHLPSVMKAINSSCHVVTKFSPYQILGIHQNTGVRYIDRFKNTDMPDVSEQVSKRLQKYQENLINQSTGYKRKISNKINQKVYVKETKLIGKLAPRYKGPAIITKLVGYSAWVKFQDGTVRKVHLDHLK